nr:MarR family transcriptional regulator [uncultured bacterium]
MTAEPTATPAPLDGPAGGEAGLPYLIARVEHTIAGRANLALGALGLTIRQMGALDIVSRSPGISSVELARQVLVTRQTMNSMIVDLAAKGAIRRTPTGTGRTIALALTDEGAALLAKAQEIAKNVEREVLGALDTDEVATLHALLRKILHSA